MDSNRTNGVAVSIDKVSNVDFADMELLTPKQGYVIHNFHMTAEIYKNHQFQGRHARLVSPIQYQI